MRLAVSRATTGLALSAGLWLLGGCASLSPALPPIDSTRYGGLQDDPAIVEASAGDIARPWLKPVPIDFARPLDGFGLSALAVVANPDLKVLRKRARVADAQVYSAGLLPDPVLSFGVDFVIGGPVTTLGNALAGSISQDLNALRTRSAALSAARASARQVRLDLAWAEWQTAGQARLLASRVTSLEMQRSLLRDAARLSRSLSERTQRAAGRGDIAGDQLQTARLAELDALTQLNQAEASARQARQDLLRVLGLSPVTALALAPMATAIAPPDCAAVFARARHRPDLAALSAGFDAQSAALRQSLLERFPSLGLTVNSSRNESGNRFLGPAVSLTLPLWNGGRGTIAIALATREALQAEYDARVFKTRADIFDLCVAMTVTGRQLVDARRELPALSRFAAATARAAGRGDLAQSAADSAAVTLLTREVLVEQLRQAQAERAIGLEIASGTIMQAWGTR